MNTKQVEIIDDCDFQKINAMVNQNRETNLKISSFLPLQITFHNLQRHIFQVARTYLKRETTNITFNDLLSVKIVLFRIGERRVDNHLREATKLQYRYALDTRVCYYHLLIRS